MNRSIGPTLPARLATVLFSLSLILPLSKSRAATSLWVPTTSLLSAQEGPAVAVGLDGLIYAIGGANGPSTWNAVNTAERFNEATATWEYIQPLAQRRLDAKAVTDSLGRIWVIGGTYDNTVLNSIERYDPSSGSWETVSPALNEARCCHGAAIAADGSIYVFGGWRDPFDPVNVQSVERYDPGTNTWGFVSPMNEARWLMAYATDSQGRIYAIGGTAWGGSPKRTVERLDPATGLWDYVANYPQAICSSFAFALDGEIWVVGSWAGADYVNTCHIYSPDLNEWRPGPSMYEPVGHGGAAVSASGTPYLVGGNGWTRVAMLAQPGPWVPTTSLQSLRVSPGVAVGPDGLIYAIGGATGTTTWSAINTVERFDETTRTWQYTRSINQQRLEGRAVTDSLGRIWLIGGIDGANYLGSVERRDPASGLWTVMTEGLNIPRASHAAVIAADDSIYVFGGSREHTSAGNLDSAERYDPATDEWTFISPMNEARMLPGYTMDDQGRIYAIAGQRVGESVLQSVERYDPATDNWEYVRPYPMRVSGASAFTLRGEIWVVGGWLGGYGPYTGACFIYSPDTNSWRPGPHMYEGVGIAPAAVGRSGTVYLVGGQGPRIQARDRVAMFVPPNSPPVADAGGIYVARATSWDGARVVLCGGGSYDPDRDVITYAWDLDLAVDGPDPDSDPANDVDSTEVNPTAQFPIGQTDISLIVTDEHGLASVPAVTTVTVSVIDVAIDIKPGSYPNSINLGSNGVVPVAFLTTPGFDASTVDPMTVTLRGEGFCGLVALRGKKQQPMASLEDVDGDGDLDLVVHLDTENLALEPGALECTLGALTYDLYVVSGTDTVNIVAE